MRSTLVDTLVLAACFAFAAGCSGSGSVCTSNATVSCTCSGGGSGSQTCNAEGTCFTAPCDCGTGDAGCTCAGRTCGPDSCGASSCGTCPAAQTCSAGTCVPMSGSCSPACGTGQTCVSGSCCPNSCVTTSGTCCNASDVCVMDSHGIASCGTRCDHNTDCPGSSPSTHGGGCCEQLEDTVSHTVFPYGVCVTNADATAECRCASDADCNETAYGCAPAVNATNNPVLPMYCRAAGCTSAYTPCDCNGTFFPCPSGYTNACAVSGGNSCFCGQVCTNDTMCGGAHCRQLYGCSSLGPYVCMP